MAMISVKTGYSYAPRWLVAGSAGFLMLAYGLWWSGVDLVPVQIYVVLLVATLVSALLAIVLLVPEWLTRGDNPHTKVIWIDTALAVGWLVGIGALTFIWVSGAAGPL